MKQNIRAILFDSGMVLNGPVTGHWFITPNFFKYIDKKVFFNIANAQRKLAFSKASQYIDRHNFIKDEIQEYKYFKEYYRIFFQQLPDLKCSEEQIDLVTKDLVFNYDKYAFYKDVYEIIPTLSQKYKLAVVSDAWPSLNNVFKKSGLRDYFSSFVISSQLGVCKPNERMYQTALNELGVSAEETIFIDDSMKNCEGAKRLGIQTFLLSRDFKYFLYNKVFHRETDVLRNLKSLNKLITF